MSETPKLLCDVTQTRAALGNLSRSSVYILMSSGDLETVRIGHRVFVTWKSLEAYVERRAKARVEPADLSRAARPIPTMRREPGGGAA